MLCLQLFVHEDTLGALDLLAHEKAAFTDESEHIGLLLASHAAIAVAGAQKLGHAAIALVNRDLIGQAKGILMERYKLTADQAFGVLDRVSQELNRKLVDIARELTDTGAVPGGNRAGVGEPPGPAAITGALRSAPTQRLLANDPLLGPNKRFIELARRIKGVSQKVLTQTLRGLERDGLLTLTVHATVPPRVNHEPTNLGRTLHARSRPYRMALGHMADVLAAREAYDAQHARPRRLTDAAGQQCRSVPAG